MTDAVIVFCTCSSRDEALRVAHGVVEEGAATCVNIIPLVESVYRWEGKIETAQEVLLLMKSTRERFEALRDLVLKLHSYETPEIIAVPVVAGLPKYLQWLGATIAT
jgi:periplasmic divalent cation tolerance protein